MPYKPTHANGTFTKFGAPEIDKLYNDRYRIVVRCNVKGVDSKWHYSNVENFWKDFGSLYESPLQVDGADVGWEPATGETYPNMRLIEVAQNYPRTPNDGAPVLEFTYETLTSSYVQDADDKVDHELNGLRRVTRTVIAKEDSSYAKVVGTDTIDHTGRGYGSETLTLASAEEVPKRENEGGFTRIRETWLEDGVLNASKEFNRDGLLYVTFYSQGSKVTPTALNSGKLLTDIETEAFQGGADAPVRYSKVQDVNGFKKFQVTVMLLQDGSPLVDGGADNAVQSYQKYEKYKRPGTFTLAADAVTGSPGNTRDVLVTVTEVISTDSTLAASYKPFSVTNWTDYNYRYIPTSTGLPVVKNGAADGYLGSGSFASTGGEVFGVEVDSAVGTAGSNPSPSAFNSLSNQVISSSNDPAFTTDEGVKWYRKIKVQMVGTMAANLGSV